MQIADHSPTPSGRSTFVVLATSLFAMSGISSAVAQNPQAMPQQQDTQAGSAQQVIEEWPSTSSKVAQEMIQKYGEPDGVTDAMLVWNDNGPWVRTIVHKEEIQHNFPVPHKDVLEQFINYEVPAEKFSDLAQYDGSVVAYRTNGELSARCDKEGANILALNLADDLIEGERSIDEARAFYAQTIQQVKQGEKPDYVQNLQFETRTASATADPDEQFDERMAASAPAGSETSSSTQATARSESGGAASLTSAELTGKDLLSADGEVVGEITEVGYSEEHGEEAARVEMSSLLGIGTNQLVVPLSELSVTAEGEVKATMTRDELESTRKIEEDDGVM